jgi:hypothetical protein
LSKVYYEQAKSIRLSPSRYKILTLQAEFRRLQTEKATDELFESLLENLDYNTDRGNKPLKYLLITLEHYWAWFKGGANGKPKCKDTTRIIDFSTTTLEHIYPQSADGTFKNSSLDAVVHDLGNITLMPPEENDRIANVSFARKKPSFKDSSIAMNRSLCKQTSWNVAAVRRRKEELMKLALAIFTV